MEAIVNYKLEEFLVLEEIETIHNYLAILEHLLPAIEVNDPIYEDFPPIKIKPIKSLSFGVVTSIRQCFKEGSVEAICKAVALVTGINEAETLSFPIIDFYGIVSSIQHDLEQLTNMEVNALHVDEEDPVLIEVQASERMAKFETLNLINSLAGDDVTKWKEIQELPYLTVFTKLVMDKEKAAINKDVNAVQERKQKQ